MEEAIFLAKFASKVTIVTGATSSAPRRSCSTAPRAIENIELLTPYVVEEFLPGEDGALGSARLRNVETGEERELPMAGAFVAVGHVPQSEIVDGIVDTDENGYVAVDGPLDAHATCRACSRPATSSTTPTARRSRPPARAVRRRSTPSGTCATTRTCRRRAALEGTGDLAEEQWVRHEPARRAASRAQPARSV